MPYANPVIKLEFQDLSSDWVTDPIWVTIRNPRQVPPDELRPKGIDSNDEEAVMAATFETMAKLVVGWRVYDASAPIKLDVNGDPVGEPELLPHPATPALVRKLPLEIVNRIGEEVNEAVNPR
ncbi:MAG: hypothetical protein JWL97_4217 [Gemmatimonadales bacterium]|nr:hypothetical protein [Gemmatimonadales bacterium]